LSSPSAFLPRVQHSGKIVFPECPIFGTRGSTWHSGNFASPVVRDDPAAARTTALAVQVHPRDPHDQVRHGAAGGLRGDPRGGASIMTRTAKGRTAGSGGHCRASRGASGS
jgi:hypothetical protein